MAENRNTVLSLNNDGYVRMGDPFANNTHFTIMLWVKNTIAPDGAFHGFIGKQGDAKRKPSMWMAPNGELHFDIYSEAGDSFGGILPGFFNTQDEWIHVTWVKDGEQGTLYKNGELFASIPMPANFFTVDSTYWIGRVDNFWVGQLAEVSIWDRALAPSEIELIKDVQLTGFENGLRGYWRLNDDASNTIQDHSSSQNEGTLIAPATWSQDAQLPFRQSMPQEALMVAPKALRTLGFPVYPTFDKPGLNQYALRFDGTNGIALPQDPFANTEKFTLMLWVKPENLNDGTHHGILGKMGDRARKPGLWVGPNDGSLHYFTQEKSAAATIFMGYLPQFFTPNDIWVHIAWVKDGNEFRFYKNGAIFATQPAPTEVFTTPGSYFIGQVDNYFRGEIAEVSIWREALSAQTIQLDVQRRANPTEFGLTSLYLMEEGKGTQLTDAGPLGNNGTLTNQQWKATNNVSTGEAAESITHKMQLKAQQLAAAKIAAAKASAHETQQTARTQAEQQLASAHADATATVNNTKFRHIFFISGQKIKKITPEGVVSDFNAQEAISKSFAVSSTIGWQRTGIQVNPNRKFTITHQSGSWFINVWAGTTGPNGTSQFIAKTGLPMPGRNEGAMIGRVGSTVFFVGSSFEIPNNLTGELELVINDDINNVYGNGLGDNSGSITMRIVEEPRNPIGGAIQVLASDLALDLAENAEKIYWSRAVFPYSVNVCLVNGEGYRKLFDAAEPVTSIAMNFRDGFIYYMEGSGKLVRGKLDGTERTELANVSAPAKAHMWQLDVDLTRNKLVWSDESSIWQCNLDGSNIEMIVPPQDAHYPIDVAVDDQTGKVYWVDKDNKLLKRATLDKAVDFTTSGNIVLPNDSFPTGNEMTVSFWAFGASNLPTASVVFSATDVNGTRNLLVHVPWSNSAVYMDSGANNRISKAASAADFKGKWSHWAFVKDANAGTMKIYLNGKLWHSGTGHTSPLLPCTKVVIGADKDLAFNWNGRLRDLRIWSKVRSEEEIQRDMVEALDGDEDGLVSYWHLTEGAGNTIYDSSAAGRTATLVGGGWAHSQDLEFDPVDVLFPIRTPHRGLALDTNLGQIYWTDMDESGQHFIVRGNMNGTGAPTWLLPVQSEGGIALDSNGTRQHEERMLAYKKRQAARAQAQAMVKQAHDDANAQVQKKHVELQAAHDQANAQIGQARTQASSQRTSAQEAARVKKDAAAKKVSDATQAKQVTLQNARNNASRIQTEAETRARNLKKNAQDDLNRARAERSKF